MRAWHDVELPIKTSQRRHMKGMHAPRAFCRFWCCCRLLLRDWVASMAHKYPVWQVGARKQLCMRPRLLNPHGLSRDCLCNTAVCL